MSVWFTADSHFNHENVIRYSERPFANLDEMTEAIIERWNAVVRPGDIVYHLGDFALSWGRKHQGTIDALLGRLCGNKWLIVGNHDRDEVRKNPRWNKVTPYHELKLDLGGPHKQWIVLCHYPMRTWNLGHYGAWMLHGHSHGNLVDQSGKILDVGVDCHGYRPVSLEAVAAWMAGRDIVAFDHRVARDNHGES